MILSGPICMVNSKHWFENFVILPNVDRAKNVMNLFTLKR